MPSPRAAPRVLAVAAATLLTVLAATVLTGCAEDDALGRDAVAVAKCFLPVSQRLQPGVDAAESAEVQRVPNDRTEVRRLANGRREVTGSVDYHGATHAYVCVVAPDPSDSLRHLRVESLTVD